MKLLLSSLAFLVIFTGCTSAQVKNAATSIAKGAAVAAITLIPTFIPTPAPALQSKTIIVKKGDSLWKITKDSGADPFLWPILWNRNRDQVLDPDWIDVGTELTLPLYIDSGDVAYATELAEKRPSKPQPRTRLRVP